MPKAFIALGSNLGDRRAYLDQALESLRAEPGIEVVAVSSFLETDPVGGPAGQGRYLNGAAELQVELPPDKLLAALLRVEQGLGRIRMERDGPRTVDLDLLLYDGHVCREPGLEVPHPRLHERRFVLEPLAAIAPTVVHPALGKSIRQLFVELQSRETPGRELTGLRVLVTGSTSGIGRAIAGELTTAGADVLIHGRREASARHVAEELGRQDRRTAYVLADLRSREACEDLVTRAWEKWGGLDAWINNAGADTLTGEAARWPFERKLQELLAVDVVATMALSRAVGARMQGAGFGIILNMGWDQAETGMEGDSGQLFGATKGAVMAFSRSLAVSLAPAVRVNCLAPGWIRTAWGEGASAEWQERARREAPLGRWGTPHDVAATARWLLSPAASFTTGQIIRVNGGAVR